MISISVTQFYESGICFNIISKLIWLKIMHTLDFSVNSICSVWFRNLLCLSLEWHSFTIKLGFANFALKIFEMISLTFWIKNANLNQDFHLFERFCRQIKLIKSENTFEWIWKIVSTSTFNIFQSFSFLHSRHCHSWKSTSWELENFLKIFCFTL